MSTKRPLTQNIKPDRSYVALAEYRTTGGYHAVRKVLGKIDPEDVQSTVKDANLKGRGGAGFNTGMKWSFVPMADDAPKPRYIVANGDEMEPGTFKDRLLMEGDPHQLVEGMILSGYAIGASVGYVFIRWAYHLSTQRMERAIAEAYDAGLLGRNILGSGFDFDLHVHSSAGRYMCGEETGLLNALEGKRATPRAKPPYPQVSGLWGKPTIVNNIETLCNVPHILQHGTDWYHDLSNSDEEGGTKLYGVSGKAKQPGLWELPLGVSAREIIEEHAGGMRDGVKLKGFLPGGASTDFMTAEQLDETMDFGNCQKIGTRLGTGTLVLLDDHTCVVGMCENLERFFAQESCGWCTPCRDGLPWTAKILGAIERGRGTDDDIARLHDAAKWLGPGNTFCALAPGAMEPLQSALKHWGDDFERHLGGRGCPYKQD